MTELKTHDPLPPSTPEEIVARIKDARTRIWDAMVAEPFESPLWKLLHAQQQALDWAENGWSQDPVDYAVKFAAEGELAAALERVAVLGGQIYNASPFGEPSQVAAE